MRRATRGVSMPLKAVLTRIVLDAATRARAAAAHDIASSIERVGAGWWIGNPTPPGAAIGARASWTRSALDRKVPPVKQPVD
eukprot:6043547-Pyramimonas_sp.AAC.1